jgi:cell division protease FtsH
MSPVIGRWAALKDENPVTAAYTTAPATLDAVDAEVQRIVGECYAHAQQLLRGNRDRLEGLASALLERETLDARAAREAAGFTSDQSPAAPPEVVALEKRIVRARP